MLDKSVKCNTCCTSRFGLSLCSEKHHKPSEFIKENDFFYLKNKTKQKDQKKPKENIKKFAYLTFKKVSRPIKTIERMCFLNQPSFFCIIQCQGNLQFLVFSIFFINQHV